MSVNAPSPKKINLGERRMTRDRSRRRQRTSPALTIDQVDEFHQCCAQAIAIASLLMEADSDPAVQNSAWAIRSLVERAVTIIEGPVNPA
jgi:hypothetical protein